MDSVDDSGISCVFCCSAVSSPKSASLHVEMSPEVWIEKVRMSFVNSRAKKCQHVMWFMTGLAKLGCKQRLLGGTSVGRCDWKIADNEQQDFIRFE